MTDTDVYMHNALNDEHLFVSFKHNHSTARSWRFHKTDHPTHLLHPVWMKQKIPKEKRNIIKQRKTSTFSHSTVEWYSWNKLVYTHHKDFFTEEIFHQRTPRWKGCTEEGVMESV